MLNNTKRKNTMIPAVPLCVWLLLSLPSFTSPACFRAKATLCQDADFVPGSDLAGEGFDITKMKRIGAYAIDMSKWERENNTCKMCKNPFMQGKKQKLPSAVVDWRSIQKCHMSLTSTVYDSSESLVSSSSSAIENNWKAGLSVGDFSKKVSVMVTGTNSKLAEYSMEKTKKDKFSFVKQGVSCEYYSYRTSIKSSVHHELSHEFSSLPEMYNEETKTNYWSLVEKFGTHYITQVKLGGGVHSVTSVKECMASLKDISADDVKTCLGVEASASMGPVSVDAAVNHCKQMKDKKLNHHSFSHEFSDRLMTITGGHTQDPSLLFSSRNDPGAYKQWLSSVPEKPDIISYSLAPLHRLLPVRDPKRKQLRSAISHYILQRALVKKCSTQCKIGVARNSKEPCSCSCHHNPGVTPNCCPAQRGYAQVVVVVERATDLHGDYWDQTDGYVVLTNNKKSVDSTPVIWNNNSPKWGHSFNLGEKILSTVTTLKLEVWDKDSGWDDDLLGTCSITLKAGNKPDYCSLDHGGLYYRTIVTCAPGLSGTSCSKYVGFPMSSSLEDMYVSRHAHPVPKDVLVKMGVLLDERLLSIGHPLRNVTPIFEIPGAKHKMYENLK
ncbi:Perforin-1 [Triplophysa tibetana]|uniref:Perforin-1 n=1 Tax=Triplophysa tibetana TaxID=1572043 RepID=A0A5A9MXA2_9TELE|nr:Perforin-1 [Triplophysa tibetana]